MTNNHDVEAAVKLMRELSNNYSEKLCDADGQIASLRFKLSEFNKRIAKLEKFIAYAEGVQPGIFKAFQVTQQLEV